MIPRHLREQLWEAQYDALEAAIDAAEDPAEQERQQLDDLGDERCPSCGRFEDDPSDLHAAWCQWSRWPRPSLDLDSDIPALEQVRQVLHVRALPWGGSDV